MLGALFGEQQAIADMTCDDVAAEAKALKLKNAFGAQFSILRITDVNEQSRSDDTLACLGTITTDGGAAQGGLMTVTDADGERFISVELIN